MNLRQSPSKEIIIMIKNDLIENQKIIQLETIKKIFKVLTKINS